MGLAMGKLMLGKIIVETPKHEVLHAGDGYEIRKYPPCVAAEVTYDPKEMKGDRDGGFQVLANYIGAFGKPQNTKPEAIAMTAPVITSSGGGGEAEPIAMTAPVITSSEPEPVAMTVPVLTAEGREEHAGSAAWPGRRWWRRRRRGSRPRWRRTGTPSRAPSCSPATTRRGRSRRCAPTRSCSPSSDRSSGQPAALCMQLPCASISLAL
ncbi:unnamed protein product [Triticum turgidum subsp. durum]|uniref:Uncharacterized protein n=1 Tax=Triticum turgidum subsp. durum TaxID=4567 RepID=A0A9R0VP67_TRITD|nr:unnamed protein product [Triticum turgidum subsp. durum]